ncbi:DUF3387 domain-containing protein [Wenjunlia tyrosinilytica]|nr:DUF3387 domain-containing protein [Wenjunlia tyrosinilytica]
MRQQYTSAEFIAELVEMAKQVMGPSPIRLAKAPSVGSPSAASTAPSLNYE